MLLYFLYQSVVTLLFVLIFPLVVLAAGAAGNAPFGLDKRSGLGFRPPLKKDTVPGRIWIHAASVGEVQAARVLINELRNRGCGFEFFLSTMTKYGYDVAGIQLSGDVFRFLAPLDVSVIVRRYVNAVEPDLYICMEAELWPAMFVTLKKKGIPALLLNGRLTPTSFRSYQRIRGLMRVLFSDLAGVAAISEGDGARFRELGVPEGVLRVTGNIKFDFPEEDAGEVRRTSREALNAGENIVFICGSTRTGEEEILLRVYHALREFSSREVIWVVAPRHLERIDEVRKVLAAGGIEFDLYSELKAKGRSHSVVLVDTMGDLSSLYSAGDFNFVGGSLVGKRGHNIMEAARWGRPVYYGPSIEDFRDAADILEKEGGGFRVEDGDALAALLKEHLDDEEKVRTACGCAAHAVSLQRGAAGRQAEMVVNAMAGHDRTAELVS